MTSILVVDDRAADRELLVTVLGHAGHEVREARSGAAGLELARAEPPELVIADILMPAMDGYDFVRELRSASATARIPVIFYTATYGSDDVRRLADAWGVSHTLIKPCEPQEILRVVAAALGSAPAPRPPHAPGELQRMHLRVVNAKLLEKVEELEAAERQAAESLILLETLLATAPVGFGFIDRDFRIVRMNDVLAAVTGLPLEEQLGRTVAEVIPALWPQLEPIYRRVLATGEAIVNREMTGSPRTPAQETLTWLSSYYPVALGGGIIGIGLVIFDITERRRAEDFRSTVMDTMAEGLYVMDAAGRVTFMNAAASKLLGWTEDELRGRPAHESIHFQRPDGSRLPDEECQISAVRARGEAIVVANDAFTCKDGTIVPVAYSAAPLAEAPAGFGAVVVFRDATEEQSERARVQRELDSLSWVGRIRDALDEDRLVLYSQPIVPLAGGEAREELLIRMVGRSGSIILPGSFLPAAEKFGLIAEIDHWVVDQAIRLAASGRLVEANLSAESIGSTDLLAHIGQQLRQTKADPANIVFEITETALMRDVDAGQAFAEGIVTLGCSIALDDFGTGFGSFTYLKKLPLAYLKIDIEFVRNLGSNPANQHLVKAIVSLAEAFGQQTIAEGVEDEETVERLAAYGVDYAQGYHLGRPAPIAAQPS